MSAFAKRPDSGVTAGNAVAVKVNMFKISGVPKNQIFQFDMEINEAGREIKKIPVKGEAIKNPFPSALNRKVLATILKNHPHVFKDVPVAYDGNANLYTTRVIKFENDPIEQTFMDIKVVDDENGQERERVFHATIKQTTLIELSELVKYLSGDSTNIPQPALTGLDVILMHLPAYRFITGRHHLFSHQDFAPLGEGVVAHHGYFTSVRPCKSGLFVNVDLACSAFYEPVPVVNALMDVCGVRSRDDLANFRLRDFERKKFRSYMVQVKVSMSHRSDYVRTVRVTDIGHQSAREASFKDTSGNVVTVEKYFETVYGFRLKYPNLPVLVCGTKGAMFPLEVCTIIPGQYYRHKLNPDQTAAMIKVSCNRPHIRSGKISDGLEQIRFKEAPQLADLGLSFNEEMTTVNAHTLEPPRILYGRGKSITPDSGAWNLRDLAFSVPAKFPPWGVVCFAGGRFVDKRKVEKFVSELVNMAGKMGIGCDQKYPPIAMIDTRSGRLDIPAIMMDLNKQVVEQARSNMGFVLCVMDDRENKEAYKQVKCFTDSRVGIPSQCMLAKNLGRDRGPSPQYVGNLLLKINSKLGGRNHDPEKNLTKFFTDPTIIFGADVTHPGVRSNNPSIVALVASQDPYMSKYSAMLTVQGPNQEHIDMLKNMVKEQLRRFYNANKSLKPSRLIFFRDGVSEGQFRQVFDMEITAIRGACFEIQPDYKPTITFVVVQKRHHVRFFPTQEGPKFTDRSGNVKAGTVVDTDIITPTEFDFYLQSHAGIQGTSRPAHYYVLLDENGFKSNTMAEFINNSCYVNVRCTRAVSIPPAVYYAHLVAYRGRILSRGDWASDTGSMSSGVSERDLLPLHENLEIRTPMFYV